MPIISIKIEQTTVKKRRRFLPIEDVLKLTKPLKQDFEKQQVKVG
jgi:hypothetical protein